MNFTLNNKIVVAILCFTISMAFALNEKHLINEIVFNVFMWLVGPMLILPVIIICILEEIYWEDRVEIIFCGIAGYFIGTLFII